MQQALLENPANHHHQINIQHEQAAMKLPKSTADEQKARDAAMQVFILVISVVLVSY